MSIIYCLKKNSLLIVILTLLLSASALTTTFTLKSTMDDRFSVYVVIDAGHGGSDGGAVSKNGLKESDVTLTIAKTLKKTFQKYGIGVVMTREKDEVLGDTKRKDMEARKAIIESASPAAVISIHANTFPSKARRGAQTFYSGEQGKELARFIQTNLNTGVNSIYNGNEYSTLKGDYYILKCTDFPSCIVECGFLSNPDDEKLLQDEKYIKDLTYAVFSATVAYINRTNAGV